MARFLARSWPPRLLTISWRCTVRRALIEVSFSAARTRTARRRSRSNFNGTSDFCLAVFSLVFMVAVLLTHRAARVPVLDVSQARACSPAAALEKGRVLLILRRRESARLAARRDRIGRCKISRTRPFSKEIGRAHV